MRPSPFVVELTGARGVGKSTLAGFIRAEFARRKVPLDVMKPLNRTDRVRLNLLSVPAILRLEGLCRSWSLSSYGETRELRRRLRRYRFRMSRFSRESGIFLLEEGLFQLMMMIAIRTGRDAQLIASRLSELVPMPDLVISVEATEEAIDARRRQRGNERDLLKPRMSSRSREGLQSMQAYMKSLSGGGKTKAIIVENIELSNLEAIASDVVEEVLTRFGPHSIPLKSTSTAEDVSP